MTEKLTDDESRLLGFFRCLSEGKQSDILLRAGSHAMEECLPEKSIYELMPNAAGVEPEGIEFQDDRYSVRHVIYCGILETGDPEHYLIGSSAWDEEEAVPRFVFGAEEAALDQGSFFKYDEEFASKYLKAWRLEILFACVRAKKNIVKAAPEPPSEIL